MRHVNLAIWVVLAACVAGLEIIGRRGVAGFSSGGRVLATVRARAIGRAVLVASWMWIGWHVFAR